MLTKRWMMALGMFLGVLAVAGSALAQGGPGGGMRGPAPGMQRGGPGAGETYRPMSTPTPQATVSGGDYDEIIREANMNPAQQKSITQITADEQKALTNFDKEHAKQIEDINKKIADLQKKQDDLNKLTIDANAARLAFQKQIDAQRKLNDQITEQRAKLSHTFKVRAMGLFTPPQKARWVAYKLNRMLAEEFTPVGLSPEQQDKMKELCAMDGQTATKPDVSTDKVLVDTAKQQVQTTILTDEQRQKYAEIVQERQNRAAGIQPVPPPA